jgi:S-adenosylmethionine hydrolase
MLGHLLLILAVGAMFAASPVARAEAPPAPQKTIDFMTDFGLQDESVGICKAVMDAVALDVRVLDITHAVEPYNIAQAARYLAGAAAYLPKEAVLVVVVDPGVGSARKAIIARSGRVQYFVLPDNGLLTLVQDRDGILAAREITNIAWMIGVRRSSTFHGRDIFSPAAAQLARGDDWTKAGSEVEVAKLVHLDKEAAVLDDRGVRAEVIGIDGPYGNLILKPPGELFAQLGYKIGDAVPVELDNKAYAFALARTFSDVAVAAGPVYVNSRGRMSLGINQRNFAEVYMVGEWARLFIPRKVAPETPRGRRDRLPP